MVQEATHQRDDRQEQPRCCGDRAAIGLTCSNGEEFLHQQKHQHECNHKPCGRQRCAAEQRGSGRLCNRGEKPDPAGNFEQRGGHRPSGGRLHKSPRIELLFRLRAGLIPGSPQCQNHGHHGYCREQVVGNAGEQLTAEQSLSELATGKHLRAARLEFEK